MKNKSIIALTAAYLILSVCIPASSASSNTINWYSYDEAKTLGKKSAGKIFLYFYSTSCHYCGLMEKNTLSNPSVAKYLNQNFTSIKVNSDREKNISNIYRIRGNPTNYFLTEGFKVIGQLPGYLPPKDLLNILKYIHTDSFKKMTLNDFLKKSNP